MGQAENYLIDHPLIGKLLSYLRPDAPLPSLPSLPLTERGTSKRRRFTISRQSCSRIAPELLDKHDYASVGRHDHEEYDADSLIGLEIEVQMLAIVGYQCGRKSCLIVQGQVGNKLARRRGCSLLCFRRYAHVSIYSRHG
jgi:hypothetical protein